MSHSTGANQIGGAVRAAEIAAAPPAPPNVVLRNVYAPEARTFRDGPPRINSNPTKPGHIEAHGEPEVSEFRAAQRIRCALIAGVGISCVLVIALTLKSAGCTYAEIQWPITIVVMIMGMFLTPAFANSIA